MNSWKNKTIKQNLMKKYHFFQKQKLDNSKILMLEVILIEFIILMKSKKNNLN